MKRWIRTMVLAVGAVFWVVSMRAQTPPPSPPPTPPPAPPPAVETGTKVGLVIRGFISASVFLQNQNFTFGNGQNTEWPAGSEFAQDKWFTGGDVRNTRLTLAFNGPKIGTGAWRLGGALETDFFGGFTGTGAFEDEQPKPRLRLAYADIGNGRTTIRIGQFWSPLFGFSSNAATSVIPVSTSHLAFPLGYGSGMPGWRFPGIFWYQALSPKDAAVTSDFVLAVMAGSWDRCVGGTVNGDCPTGGANSNIASLSAGNAGWPQIEGRFNLSGKVNKGTWGVYVVGHWDQKDLSGANSSLPNDKLDGWIGSFGAKYQMGGFLIQGEIYTSDSAGQQFTAITQFGEIKSTGGWIQAGYDFTPNWGVYGFYALDDPDDDDTLAAFPATSTTPSPARLKNEIYSGMLRWKTGPYALGLEYLHAKLETKPRTAKVETDGDQIILSALYNF